MTQLALSLTATAALPDRIATPEAGPLDHGECVYAAYRLLAEGRPVSELTPAVLARAIAATERDFYELYPDIRDLLTALLKLLLEEVTQETITATNELMPSLLRMCQGIWAALSAHLRRPAIRELCRALRGHEDADHARRVHCARVLMAYQVEFHAVGVPHAATHAALINAMVLETARAEHRAGHSLPVHRRAVCDYLRSLHPRRNHIG